MLSCIQLLFFIVYINSLKLDWPTKNYLKKLAKTSFFKYFLLINPIFLFIWFNFSQISFMIFSRQVLFLVLTFPISLNFSLAYSFLSVELFASSDHTKIIYLLWLIYLFIYLNLLVIVNISNNLNKFNCKYYSYSE